MSSRTRTKSDAQGQSGIVLLHPVLQRQLAVARRVIRLERAAAAAARDGLAQAADNQGEDGLCKVETQAVRPSAPAQLDLELGLDPLTPDALPSGYAAPRRRGAGCPLLPRAPWSRVRGRMRPRPGAAAQSFAGDAHAEASCDSGLWIDALTGDGGRLTTIEVARRRTDVRELVAAIVRTRWERHCRRNRLDELAAVVEIELSHLEKLAAIERKLVAELKRVAPERLEELDRAPASDRLGELLNAAIAEANRLDAERKKRSGGVR